MNAAGEFHKDPFLYLDGLLPTVGAAVRWPDGELCLADAEASRAVLANVDGLYEDHSDFFHTRRGMFGPRPLQVELGRAAMKVLYAVRQEQAPALEQELERALLPRSDWPDAGNWLVYRHLLAALIAPTRPASLRRKVDQIVERAVLAGARERRSLIGRAIFRFRVMRELALTLEQIRKSGGSEPVDILDVLAFGSQKELAGREVPAKELAEIFLSFLFAVAGSVGFTLGWSLYLLGMNPGCEAKPAWVVREALRLYPVAWLFGRRPAQRHEIAGVAVESKDDVMVCPYVVHRNPRYWDDPASFRPERWSQDPEPEAFLPFGVGAHKCVGASFSLRLVEDILQKLSDGYRMEIEPHGERPQIGAALAPPRFTLRLETKR